MAAVNWDLPSTGLVSDPAPSLLLDNDKGPALQATARGIALDAVSKDAEALRARAGKAVAANIRSDESTGVTAYGPKASGVVGVNQAATIAVAGVNLVDPKKPSDSLDGIGVAGISGRAAAYGVVGATFGIRSTGVLGMAENGGVGVRGSGAQGGVQGVASESHGVAGTTQSATASGVFGYAPGAQGAGVSGQSVAGAGVDGSSSAGPGVHGASAQARGVVGESTGANAAGVFGQNDLGSGVGVDGYSKSGMAMRAVSSSGLALHAESFGGGGIDVSNFSGSQPAIKAYSSQVAVDAASLLSTAVRGFSAYAGVNGACAGAAKAGDPQAGCGVYGNSIGAAGVCGITLVGTGVLGIGFAKLGAMAGRFVGDVHVEGTIFKYASLFSIDHPLDPKRKVLNHACVEAPEYKTFYDGIATLDRRGHAVVKLPAWFDALNHELRYQLTAVGGPAPELHLAREAAKGSFEIGGGQPRQKVCWQVTGVRRDAWAKANPMRVEQSRASARRSATPVSVKDVERAAAKVEKAIKAVRADDKARRKAQPQSVAPAAGRKIASSKPIEDAPAVSSTKSLLREAQRLAAATEPTS